MVLSVRAMNASPLVKLAALVVSPSGDSSITASLFLVTW